MQKNLLKTFVIELKNRNYAKNTIKSYKRHIQHFIKYSNKYPDNPAERIPLFLDSYSKSYEQKRIACNAIKIFYKLVIKKECPYTLDNPKRRKRLPSILDKDEILTILSKIINKKHYLMIALLYSSGLRVSEVVSLKVKDIDLKAFTIRIRDSKHHQDRFTVFSDKLRDDLEILIKDRQPGEYLFLTISNKKYSIRTVQQILENAHRKTNINKKVTSPY